MRVVKAVQGNQEFIKQFERYELLSLGTLQNKDFHSIPFIHNHIFESKFVTPAGQDKVFPYAKTIFTVLVTGDNFPSFEKTIEVDPKKDTKKLIITL